MANKKNEVQEMNWENESKALNEAFVALLQDILWAEKHLTKALPKMAKAATSPELKQGIEKHIAETENQVKRLEEVFSILGKKATAKKCAAMEGLIKEGEEAVEDTEDGTFTRDVMLIASSQKIEHYEIASYGTMATLAKTIGQNEIAELLIQTLEEEKNADALLTQVAESNVNQAALQEN